MDYEREIEDVVEAILKAKDENVKINLLIGAGCSVTAGIPTAEGIMKEIKEKYPRDYERADPKEYGICMSKLTPSERRNLINKIVNDSKINWAHIAIAQLLKNGYIDRILTTNFDNLVQRACALVEEFPGIYDLTTSSKFRSDLLFDKSIIHLHGQHTGFILCNTEEELNEQLEIVKPVFEQLSQKSLWIIVGYSGQNDPVFQLLSEKELFENRLFWIGYRNNEPSEHLSSKLLSEEKYAYYVKGFDADDFFVKISQSLKCFPPSFIQKPFSYLLDKLETLSEYTVPEVTSYSFLSEVTDEEVEENNNQVSGNIQLTIKSVVKKAIESIENDCNLMAEHYLMAGLYENVLELDSSNNEIELEKTIIHALCVKGKIEEDRSSLISAKERISNLLSNTPEDDYLHTLLSNTFLDLFSLDLTGDPPYRYNNLLSGIDSFVQGYRVNPTVGKVEVWQVLLGTLCKCYNILKKTSGNIAKDTLSKYIFNFIDTIEEDQRYFIDESSSPISMLNPQLAYSLIENKEFDLAEKVLSFHENYEGFMSEDRRPFAKANYGLYYLSRLGRDLYSDEDLGVKYYNESLEYLAALGYDEYSVLYKAFSQKYYLEYSKFLFNRMKDLERGTDLLNKCYEIGELEGFQSIYDEAFSLMNDYNLLEK